MRLPVYERRAGVSPLNIPQVQPNPQVSDNGETAAKTLHGVFTRMQEIQDGMDDARTLELFNRFKQDSQEYHENPDRGIYNTRFGFQASGLYKDADEWLRRKGEDYARQLPSRRAQFNFRKMAREHIQQRGMQNSRFEAEQMRRYQQETANATIKERLNYAETHWDDNAAIAQVRTDIQQALELKMRGSGKEAFTAAMMEIEDQIGAARIRQAVVQNPMLGIDMLKNPDIHLKSDTRAKLTEYLKNRTEIYRIHGIVQEYAKQYSPENAVKAQEVLIQRFGTEEGQKAFAALTRHWSIQHSQDSVRKQQQIEQQQKNENQLLDKWNDFLTGQSAAMPDIQEFAKRAKAGEISRTFASGMIGRIISKLEAEQADQAKKEKARKEIERWTLENRGVFASDVQIEQFVSQGYWTTEDATHHKNAREAYAQRLEQKENKRFEDNKQNFIDKFLRGELTDEIISKGINDTIIRPSDALTLKGYLRTERERTEAEQRRDTQEAERLQKKAQEEYEGSLRVILGMGGRVSKKQATELYDNKKIGQTFLEHLYSLEDQHQQKEERSLNEQAKQQAKTQSDTQKLQDETDDDKRAMKLAEMYPDGYTGDGLEIIKNLDLPPKRRDNIEKRYLNYVKNNQQRIKDIENLQADSYKKRYSWLWYETNEFVNTQDEINAARKRFDHMRGNDELKKTEHSELTALLDGKERELKAKAAQQDKLAGEQRKDELDRRVKNTIVPAYGLEKEGQAREFIHNLPDAEYSREDKDFMISRLEAYMQDAKTKTKNTTDAAKQVRDEIYEDMITTDILGRSLTNEEITQLKTEYLDKRNKKEIDEQQYNRLIAALDNQQRANNEAAEKKRKNDNYDIAKDYADQFGLDGQDDARKKIREEYLDTRANEIMTQFDRLIQEKQDEQNSKDKALRLQQEQNFTDLQNQYWRNSMIIPEQVLRDHEQNRTLTTAQLGQIRAVNAKMTTKDGRREELAKLNAEAWTAMSPQERETKVMQSFGVSEDTRKETVSYLFQKAVDGTLTNVEIEDNRAGARIYDEDAENLRTFDTKFARLQKQLIGVAASQMHNIIEGLYINDQKKKLNAWNNAYTAFQLQTLDIDTHDKNFTDNLKGIVQRIMDQVFTDYEEIYKNNLTERVFPWIGDSSIAPTKAGERLNTAREKTANLPLPQITPAIPYSPMSGDTQFISPTGVTQNFRPAPAIPETQTQQQLEQAKSVWQEIQQAFSGDTFGGGYDPSNNAAINNPLMQRYINPANHNKPRPQNGVEAVKSIAPSAKYRITGEYSAKPTLLRNGRGHLALDWGMPIGTQLFAPTYSNTWRVITTGENPTAGKFIKFQATTASGDVHEYTYAHLSSVDVKAGDVVASGDVVAKSGNSGHSTGPHLHVGLKVNGKAVDPRNVDLDSVDSSGDMQEYAPEPIVPPVISTDEEFEAAALELFGLNPLWSSDVFDNNGNFGRRF